MAKCIIKFPIRTRLTERFSLQIHHIQHLKNRLVYHQSEWTTTARKFYSHTREEGVSYRDEKIFANDQSYIHQIRAECVTRRSSPRNFERSRHDRHSNINISTYSQRYWNPQVTECFSGGDKEPFVSPLLSM